MDSGKLMRSIIIGKLVLGIAALGLYQGWFQIGDIAAIAGDTKKAAETKTPDKANDNASEVGAKSDSEAADATTENEEKEEDTPEVKERKSFLADLFSLPKLDPKKARKEEVGKYLSMAERKQRQIDEREAMLSKREDQLKNIEKSIDEKLSKMEEERKFIAKTLQDEKDLKGERLDKLVTLYDKMEPKKAATQFEKLDKDLVVALFKKLKQKQVTTILEFMSPDKSASIAEYFGRVKSGREYDLLKELNSSLRKEFAECKGMPADTMSTENTPAASTDGQKSPEAGSAKTAANAKDEKPAETKPSPSDEKEKSKDAH